MPRKDYEMPLFGAAQGREASRSPLPSSGPAIPHRLAGVPPIPVRDLQAIFMDPPQRTRPIDLYEALAANADDTEMDDLSPTAALGMGLVVGFVELWVWFTRPRTLIGLSLAISTYFAVQMLRGAL